MKYFFISQDISLPCCIAYRDFNIRGGRHLFLKQDADRINDMVFLYLTDSGREAKPDFIQRPVTMFSDRLKEVLEAYEPELLFKNVMLIHKENRLQYHYVHVLMEPIDVLSEKTVCYPNGVEQRVVIDGNKAKDHHIFLPAGIHREDPVISLSVAESILRRRVTGICFEEVEVE